MAASNPPPSPAPPPRAIFKSNPLPSGWHHQSCFPLHAQRLTVLSLPDSVSCIQNGSQASLVWDELEQMPPRLRKETAF